MKPRDRLQTFKAGYIKDSANMTWDEHVDVTVGIKNRDLSMSQIILNISEQKIIKNSFNNEKSFMELFQYFYTSSPYEISQALKNCGISVSEPKDPENVEPVQENVSIQAEEGARSVAATTTDSVGASEGDKKRRRKPRVNKDPAATTTPGDKSTEDSIEPSIS